jgi:hypothetical protein
LVNETKSRVLLELIKTVLELKQTGPESAQNFCSDLRKSVSLSVVSDGEFVSCLLRGSLGRSGRTDKMEYKEEM